MSTTELPAAVDTPKLIADIDSMDAQAFASNLSENCVLRYANNEEVTGRDAIEAAIAGFYGTIKGLRHEPRNEWTVGDTTILQFDVTYTRHDGGQVTVPAVSIVRTDGELVDDYRIYVDLTPVYA
jgi:ketosteroid isomerase-like protein